MSVTQVGVCADVAGRTSYVFVGVGDRQKKHLEAGTHRAAAMHVDGGSVQNFVRQGQQWATTHGRKNQALSYIQSWHLDELQPSNSEHVTMARDLGLELARRMHPNSPALVVTHTDGDGHDGCGGKLHNHILVLNHDVRTNKALRGHQLHYQVARTNDELMQDYGLSVVDRGKEAESGYKLTRGDHWAVQREQFNAEGQTFDAALFSKLADAVSAEHVRTWDDYVQELDSQGVEVVEDTRGRGGITYKMLDETGEKAPRIRRRKASKLSADTTRAGVQTYLDQYKQEPEKGTDHGISEAQAAAEQQRRRQQREREEYEQQQLLAELNATVSGISSDDQHKREQRLAQQREQQRLLDEQRRAARAAQAGRSRPRNDRSRSSHEPAFRPRKPQRDDYGPEL